VGRGDPAEPGADDGHACHGLKSTNYDAWMALACDRGGRGEPLVLVHGLGSRRQVWAPILPALRERYEVLALDLPGFGASPLVAPPLGGPAFGDAPAAGAASSSASADGPAFGDASAAGPASGGASADGPAFGDAPAGGPASGGASVAALADVVQAVAGDSFHVVGSSMGGGVALELGRRGVARSVTAFAPVGFWGPLSRRWCQASLTAARACARALGPALPALAATAAGRVVLFGLFFGHPGRVDPAAAVEDARALAAAPGFRAARAAFAGHRFADPGALTRIPVTVAWGARDLILPAVQARRAARLLPSARHVRLAGCGHLPFADDPGACVDLIVATTA
jgi:pimeloyl-ACP methyl ester carboxylesterase